MERFIYVNKGDDTSSVYAAKKHIIPTYKPDNCDYEINFCDTCLFFDDVVKFELNRGSVQVYFDIEMVRLGLEREFYPTAHYYTKSHTLNREFFYHYDSIRQIKEIIIYHFTEISNREKDTSIYYVVDIKKKVYKKSDYLDRRLRHYVPESKVILDDDAYFDYLTDLFFCTSYAIAERYDLPLLMYKQHERNSKGYFERSQYNKFPEDVVDYLFKLCDSSWIYYFDYNSDVVKLVSGNEVAKKKEVRYNGYTDISEYNLLNSDQSSTYTPGNIAFYYTVVFIRPEETLVKLRKMIE